MAIRWEDSEQGLRSLLVEGAIGLWHLRANDDEQMVDIYLMKSVLDEMPDYNSFEGLNKYTPLDSMCYYIKGE